MLTITTSAVEAIKAISGDDEEAGLRISATGAGSNGNGPGLRIEATSGPAEDDIVIEADGAHVYLDDDAKHVLEDTILDAETEEDGSAVRFSVLATP